MTIVSWEFESPSLHKRTEKGVAVIAQLVEHDLAKVGVASSSLVCRSKKGKALKKLFGKIGELLV